MKRFDERNESPSIRHGRSRRKRHGRRINIVAKIAFSILVISIGAMISIGTRYVLSDRSDGQVNGQLVTGTSAYLSDPTAEAPSGGSDKGSEAVSNSAEEDSSQEAAVYETPAKLLFAGDIYFSDYVLSAYDSAGDVSGIVSNDLLSLMESADIFMANLEFPFSTRGTPEEDKSFTFRVSPDRAHILNELGVDIVTLANNHTLDYGLEALEDTINTLDAIGISHTGAGEDADSAGEAVVIEAGGKTYAFLGATRVIPRADWAATENTAGLFSIYDPYKEQVFERIRELEEITDYQIVYVHWGIERSESPEPYMRELAKELAEAGADLIVGSHPHVLQGMEYIEDVPVIYSLGNFLFGSSIPSTMLLSLSWPYEGGRPKIEFYPAKGALGYTEGITDEEEAAAFTLWYESLPLETTDASQ